MVNIPKNYRGFIYIPGGCFGISEPSTVNMDKMEKHMEERSLTKTKKPGASCEWNDVKHHHWAVKENLIALGIVLPCLWDCSDERISWNGPWNFLLKLYIEHTKKKSFIGKPNLAHLSSWYHRYHIHKSTFFPVTSVWTNPSATGLYLFEQNAESQANWPVLPRGNTNEQVTQHLEIVQLFFSKHTVITSFWGEKSTKIST